MSNFSKRHTITRSQLNERAAKRAGKPGGKSQKKGTHPVEHRLPVRAAFVPMDSPLFGVDKMLRDMGVQPPLSRIPDLRCPQCDSSIMGKEGLKRCPECGYEGELVDVATHEPGDMDNLLERVRKL